MVKDRYLELSSKLIEMGHALIKEGNENKDFTITQTGTFMILIGGLLFDEKDVNLFGQVCQMFSAKKVLENLESTNNEVANYMKKRVDSETYDDFVKRINKLRGKNGFGPML